MNAALAFGIGMIVLGVTLIVLGAYFDGCSFGVNKGKPLDGKGFY